MRKEDHLRLVGCAIFLFIIFINYINFQSMGQHDEFLTRITKTLYYTKLPKTERLSLPVSGKLIYDILT